MATTLQIEYVAKFSGLQTGVQQSVEMVKRGAEEMRRSLSTMREGAEDAAKGHDGLLGKLREFRGEQVQQGRMARFYAAELMSIIPAADGVKSALQGVLGFGIEGLAGGLSFGLAFEGVKLAIEGVVHLINEAQRAEEEAAKATKEHADAVQSIAEGWHDFIIDMQAADLGASAKRFMSEWRKANEELNKAKIAVQDLEDEKTAKKRAPALGVEYAPVFGRGDLDERMSKAQSDLASKQINLGAVESGYATASQVEADEKARKEGEKTSKQAAEDAKRRAREAEQAAQQAAQADMQLALQREQALDDLGAKERQAAEARIERERIAAYTLEAFGQEQYGKELAQAEKYFREQINALEGNLAEQLKMQRQFEAEKRRIIDQAAAANTKKVMAETRSAMAESVQLSQTIGASIGQVFGSIATGTRGVFQAIAGMLQQIVQMIVQMAIKQITANAMVAGSGAAASQSGVPIVGPILAVAAMGAMIATVLGLIGNISAAGGYDIPAGVNPLVQAHAEEMILPARYADVIRGLADTGVQQGRTVNVNLAINAVDGASVSRLVRSREFRAAIMGAVRNGEL